MILKRVAVILLLVSSLTFANAAVYTWQCATNDLWSNAACWTNGDLDDAGDDMVLALSQVVTMDDDRDVKGFTISAGILSITSGDTLGLNNAHSTLSGTGTVIVDGDITFANNNKDITVTSQFTWNSGTISGQGSNEIIAALASGKITM